MIKYSYISPDINLFSYNNGLSTIKKIYETSDSKVLLYDYVNDECYYDTINIKEIKVNNLKSVIFGNSSANLKLNCSVLLPAFKNNQLFKIYNLKEIANKSIFHKYKSCANIKVKSKIDIIINNEIIDKDFFSYLNVFYAFFGNIYTNQKENYKKILISSFKENDPYINMIKQMMKNFNVKSFVYDKDETKIQWSCFDEKMVNYVINNMGTEKHETYLSRDVLNLEIEYLEKMMKVIIDKKVVFSDINRTQIFDVNKIMRDRLFELYFKLNTDVITTLQKRNNKYSFTRCNYIKDPIGKSSLILKQASFDNKDINNEIYYYIYNPNCFLPIIDNYKPLMIASNKII